MKKTKKNLGRSSGGKVIDSGGYGCVFKPALICKGKRNKDEISKMMITRKAESEYNMLTLMEKRLKSIPNYENYFLINNIVLCEPNPLTKSDLLNFKKENCSSILKDVTPKNINNNLEHLKTLNMPYGGVNVDKFVKNQKNFKYFIELNHSLIDLLKNGIIPMNQHNIYHCDIKGNNILVSLTKKILRTKLIDWGLTEEYIPNINTTVPRNWYNLPIQFNTPFSSLLFTDLFTDQYYDFTQSNKTINRKNLTEFAALFLNNSIKKNAGHYEYINIIMYMMFSNELPSNISYKQKTEEIKELYTNKYIINYLVEILLYYQDFYEDGTWNGKIYFDYVYIKIIDVWGLILSYLPVFELLYENYAILTDTDILIFNKLKKIFLIYVFEPRINAININVLSNDLQNIFRSILYY